MTLQNHSYDFPQNFDDKRESWSFNILFQGFNLKLFDEIEQHVEVRYRKDNAVQTTNGAKSVCALQYWKITELGFKFKLTHVYTHPHILLMERLFDW